MTQELMVLEQSPSIKHSLKEAGGKISCKISDLNLDNQIATEETLSTLKKIRAELNNEYKEYEAQRGIIKKAIMDPYNEFEEIYKVEISEKFKSADITLKEKINYVEMSIKSQKKANLEKYFKDVCEIENIDWLTFDKLGIEINLSTSEKKYKDQILSFIKKIVENIDLINTEKYAAETIVEFKRSLNASQSIRIVRDRKYSEIQESEKLKFQRTSKRTNDLRSLLFTYHDLTKTYNWINDENVMIKHSDVENLSDDEWTKRYVELESNVKQLDKKETPNLLKAPVEYVPDQTPLITSNEEELFEAKFIVKGTYLKLKELSEFLKENNYTYQNVD